VDPATEMRVGLPTVAVTMSAMYASRSSMVVMGVIVVMWEAIRG
jgi:hypothetical protein